MAAGKKKKKKAAARGRFGMGGQHANMGGSNPNFMMGFGMRQDGAHGHMGMGMGGRLRDGEEGLVEELRAGRTAHHNPVKYIRSLGHNVVTSLSSQTTTTLVVPTTAHNADQHDFLAVVSFLGYFGGNTGAVTCADSLGNTYVKASEVIFNTDYKLVVFYAEGVHSLAKNAVITVTHPGATRRVIMGDEFKNVTKTSSADVNAAAYNSVAAAFATSGMTSQTAQEKELIYGVIAVNGPSTDSFKKPTNWTLLHDRGTNATDGNDIRLITQFRTTGSKGTYSASGTLGTARLWGAITQTFKAEGGASDISRD